MVTGVTCGINAGRTGGGMSQRRPMVLRMFLSPEVMDQPFGMSELDSPLTRWGIKWMEIPH